MMMMMMLVLKLKLKLEEEEEEEEEMKTTLGMMWQTTTIVVDATRERKSLG